MKTHYEFKDAQRGKFYRPGATLHLPVYLNDEVQQYLSAAAERKGTSLSELVNDLLSRGIALGEAIK